MKPVAAYSLYSWQHHQAWLRLLAPWQAAGLEVQTGTQWDQISLDPVASAGIIHLHRDFPRLSQAYHQVVERARSAGIPIILDMDEDLFNLPSDHPDRQFHYRSDALFTVLQAIVEADAVTVSSQLLLEAIQPLNPHTRLLPTCLDDRLWVFKAPKSRQADMPFIIGWINDQTATPDGFQEGLLRFLQKSGEKALLRVWGAEPPAPLLNMANADWLPALPDDYAKFAAAVSRLNCDLMVIPHGDHSYFRSQSALRFFEISACGMPGIYSRVSPYREVISHGENGWLAGAADEWADSLTLLFGSEAARQATAEKAQSTIRKEWLLSHHAQGWKALFEELTSQPASQRGDKPFARQAASLADQVRLWQRDLEEQIYQKEWQVRATNVMMRRKEREASQYIDQLNAQLQGVWNSPTYRLLDRIRHPGRLFSKLNPVPSTSPAVTPQETLSPQQTFPLDILPSAKTYDIFLLPGADDGGISERQHRLLESFLQQGSRVFRVRPTGSTNGNFQAGRAGVNEIRLPDAGDIETQRVFFEKLRQDAQIYEAVCWIEDPAWLDMAFRLRNWFDWRTVATIPPNNLPERLVTLIKEHCDLSIPSTAPVQQFSSLLNSLDTLYPKASLIILTYNNLNYTRQCLESIFEKTSYPNFEVVVVDNASADGTPAYLQSLAENHSQVRLVLNVENRGFAAGNNQGVRASTGEMLVFLNNDIVVTRGWLSRLLGHLRSPLVGAVGPVTNNAGNESRISVDYSDLSGLEDFAQSYTAKHAGQTFEIRMLALFCMALPRAVIEAVGFLDERFSVGMYEDDDFSLRIRQKGYRILCAEDVYIHHWGSASFSQLATERYHRLHEENQTKFERKWGTRWQPHRQRMEDA